MRAVRRVTAPAADMQGVELLLSRKIILPAVQTEADLVYVISVGRCAVDHTFEELTVLRFLTVFLPVCLKGSFFILFRRIQTAVAFQIEFHVTGSAPVNDVSAFIRCQLLMHDRVSMIFHIAAVAADHSIETDRPDILIDFRL